MLSSNTKRPLWWHRVRYGEWQIWLYTLQMNFREWSYERTEILLVSTDGLSFHLHSAPNSDWSVGGKDCQFTCQILVYHHMHIKKEREVRERGREERESTLKGVLFYLCCVGRAERIMGDQLSKGVRFQQAYWPHNKHQLLFSFWFKIKITCWLQLVLLFWKPQFFKQHIFVIMYK